MSTANPAMVTISAERAERMWVFLNELADYGYRFGLPDDLMELIGDCLNGEDTRRSAWGLGQDGPLFQVLAITWGGEVLP